MRYFLIIPFFLFFFHAFSQTEWTAEELAQANTAEKATFLTSEEKQLILLTNLARINPAKFSKTYLEKYVSEKKLDRNDFYVKSLYEELAKQKPISPLKVSKKLCTSAAFHADDMGKTGGIGHDDSNGRTMEERFFYFVPRENYLAFSENCQYGHEKALDIFMDLFIDTGVSDLGHRINILDENLVYTGVAIRPHKTYRVNCVQDFGTFVK